MGKNPLMKILKLYIFFEIFNMVSLKNYINKPEKKLKKIKVAPYYGCMLSIPPDLRFEKSYYGIMEKNSFNAWG